MNAASKWRLDLVNPVASLYTKNPKVAAVIVGGSTARGHADKYSDIEIGVFWNEPPTDDDRLSVIENAGAELVYLYPYEPEYEVWSDDYRMGHNQARDPQSGVSVETVHYTKEFMQRTLESVLVKYNPHEDKQNLISGFMDGITIHGNELINHWRSQAALYPDELAIAVLKRHAQIDHFWRWQMWQERGENRMLIHQSFSQIQSKILHMLLAINKQYYFGFKWLDVVTDRLTIAPGKLLDRFKAVHTAPVQDSAKQLADLVEETYDRIEAHYPDLDVKWLRSVFRYRRPTWEEPPHM